MVKKILVVALAAIMLLSVVSCTARASYNFDLNEYVTLGQYKEIEISDADVVKYYTETVGDLIDSKTEDVDVTDAIVADDSLTVNVTATLDGEALPGAFDEIKTGEQTLTAGKEFFKLGGIDELFVGLKVGDTLADLQYQFPADYENEELAGKMLSYTIEITKATRKSVPTLSDEFIAANTSYKTIDEYYKATTQEYIEDTAIDTAIANATVIQYPENNVKIYYNNQVSYYEQYASYYGVTLETLVTSYMGTDVDSFLKTLITNCRKQVKNEMVYQLIAQKEGIEITDEEYNERLEAVATDSGYESGADLVKGVGKDAVVLSMLCTEVQDFIVENIKTVD